MQQRQSMKIYLHGVFIIIFNTLTCIFLWKVAGIELLSIFTLFILNAINVHKMVEMDSISVLKCKKQVRRCTNNTHTYVHVDYICVKQQSFIAYVTQIHLISYVNIFLSVFSALIGKVPLWFIALQILMHFYLLRKYRITLFSSKV